MSRCKSAVVSALVSAVMAGSVVTLPAGDAPGVDLARQLSDAFVSVAEKVSPAVVIINVVDKPRGRGRGGRQRPPEEGVGSGIVVSADGYILTNNHVVDNADKITVVLKDGREFKAEVKGTDAALDIAVIKIKPEKAVLTVARLGNSDKLRVGEFVVAIGHPYELSYSVTVGHVSAIERQLPKDPYDIPLDANAALNEPDYIQTDAVINPGNSGGPLINLDGEVIAINAMIEADTFRGLTLSRGIGLAIPINQAKSIMESLISYGKFRRSQIGLEMAGPEGAKFLLNLDAPPASGVVVLNVVKAGPAEKAGLKPKDIVLAVDGTPVNSARDWHDQISFKKPGQSVTVSVLRDNKPRTVKVTAEAEPEIAVVAAALTIPEFTESVYGFAFRTLTPELAKKLDLTVTNGVIVTGVQPSPIAMSQGININLNEGDVITILNRKPVTSAEDFRARLKAVPPGVQWTVMVVRKGETGETFQVYHAPVASP